MKLQTMIIVFMVAEAVMFSTTLALSRTTQEKDQKSRSTTPHEINITTDSALGWKPSTLQEQQAITKTEEYFTALDTGQYQYAFDMMTETYQALQTVNKYIQRNDEFRKESGPLIRRDILKVTWTKDPTSASLPGIYAAIDISSYFSNIDRHCGYIVLFQKTATDDFKVMRQEDNFIENSQAKHIEQTKSRETLDNIWAKLAQNCPNYTPEQSNASNL